MTNSQVELFLEHLRVNQRSSPNTLKAYASDLKEWLQFSNFPVGEYISHLSNINNSSATIRRKRASITSCYRYLISQEEDLRLPFEGIKAPRLNTKRSDALTVDDIDKVFKQAKTYGQAFVQVRNRAILELMYGSGLRRSEVSNMLLEDLRMSQSTLLIHGKGSKDRLVPINQRTIKAIKRYLLIRPHCDHEKIWVKANGSPISQFVMVEYFKKVFYATCLPKKNASLHSLRHACATHLYQNGMPIMSIMRFLGHSSIKTTQQYLDIEFSDVANDYRSAHPRC